MSPADPPRRGEVWWATFDGSRGGEIRKTRPVIIVSNDIANRTMNRVQIVPVTSNISRLYASEAYVTIGRTQSKAMADQIATLSKSRLRDRLGRVSADDLEAVGRAIRVQLGI